MTLPKEQAVSKKWREYSKRIAIFIERPFFAIKLIFRYSGAEFICAKFKPSKKPQPLPTGFIWLIGIYIAFFGVASQRYENRVDIIENRANSIFTQLGTTVYKKALGRISLVQNMRCPEKPKILNPFSVFSSLFEETEYKELTKLLKETLEDWKDKLDSINLQHANLREADLLGANLQRADLFKANLGKANLRRASLLGANLQGADLRETNLRDSTLALSNLKGANLREADLQGANLREANLDGTNLEGANLTGTISLNAESICKAKSLYNAKIDPEIEEQIRSTCPHLLVITESPIEEFLP